MPNWWRKSEGLLRVIFNPASTVSRRGEADESYWVAAVGSVFEVAMCAAMGTLEVASV